jgi:hypothetical protein
MPLNDKNYQAILTALNEGGTIVAEVVLASGPERLPIERRLETCGEEPNVQELSMVLRRLFPECEIFTTMRYPLRPMGGLPGDESPI